MQSTWKKLSIWKWPKKGGAHSRGTVETLLRPMLKPSCVSVRGRGIEFRHYYWSIARSAEKDVRDSAVVPRECCFANRAMLKPSLHHRYKKPYGTGHTLRYTIRSCVVAGSSCACAELA